MLAFAGGNATAQQKSLKDRLVGTWHFVIAEVTAPDGKKSFPFGPTPRGILIFTPEGDFAQIHIAERGAEDRLRQPAYRHARGIRRDHARDHRAVRHLHGRRGEEDVHLQVHAEHVPELGGHAADAHRSTSSPTTNSSTPTRKSAPAAARRTISTSERDRNCCRSRKLLGNFGWRSNAPNGSL